jgi:hypothetical protein
MELPLFIVRHSVLIICKIARIYFEAVQCESAACRQPVQVFVWNPFAATIARIAWFRFPKISATDGVLRAAPWP